MDYSRKTKRELEDELGFKHLGLGGFTKQELIELLELRGMKNRDYAVENIASPRAIEKMQRIQERIDSGEEVDVEEEMNLKKKTTYTTSGDYEIITKIAYDTSYVGSEGTGWSPVADAGI